MIIQTNAMILAAVDIAPEVTIAIIAKNEEKNIGYVLLDIFNMLKKNDLFSCEILLLDGNSSDRTAEIAQGYGVKVIKVAEGKGRAVRKALYSAKGKYVLFIDADGSHAAEDIPRLLSAIKKNDYDMVIVSRLLGMSEELGLASLDNALRLVGNKISAFIINARWNVNLTDIQNGFRIVKRDSLLSLNLSENRFAIEQEMVMKCLRANKRILEVPGIERKRIHGNSKIIKTKEFWGYVWSMLKNI